MELSPPKKEQQEQQELTADSPVKHTASGRIVKEPMLDIKYSLYPDAYTIDLGYALVLYP